MGRLISNKTLYTKTGVGWARFGPHAAIHQGPAPDTLVWHSKSFPDWPCSSQAHLPSHPPWPCLPSRCRQLLFKFQTFLALEMFRCLCHLEATAPPATSSSSFPSSSLSVFSKADVTNYHNLSDLKHRNIFSYHSESQKSEIQVLAEIAPSGGSKGKSDPCLSRSFWGFQQPLSFFDL